MRTALIAMLVLFICVYYEIVLALSHFSRDPEAVYEKAMHGSLRKFTAVFRQFMGFEFAFEPCPEDLPPRFILVSNHQSLLDIPILAIYFEFRRRLRFVAKKELGSGVPYISSLLHYQRHALIDRKGSALRVMRELDRFAARCERDGTCPVIFPEGTRSKDGVVRRFHGAGLRRIVERTPLPVVVAAVEGGWTMSNLGKFIREGAGCVYRVKVVDIAPSPGNKPETSELLARAEGLIGEALETWRAPVGAAR